jgi:16S rRNA (cytidine1402-2'-O)-methyltransferase
VTGLGTLYLIPVPLGEVAPFRVLPAEVVERTRALDAFVAENAKSARAFLKTVGVAWQVSEIQIDEIDADTPAGTIETLLAPLLAGRDLGLLSEAGCPGVADPGAALVRAAHRHGIGVRPLVGPSSLLLGLMASGLNGQSFAFCGYLPVKDSDRAQRIRELEAHSARLHQTQIFIETPYRNQAMFAALLKVCTPSTSLTVARELTLEQEWIATRTVAEWRRQPAPDLARRPAIFLLQTREI